MKWWKKALIASLVGIVLVFGASILHIYVYAGELTPAQAEAIGERYGNVGGFGLVATWIVMFLRRKPPTS